jgi:hypothetical protein
MRNKKEVRGGGRVWRFVTIRVSTEEKVRLVTGNMKERVAVAKKKIITSSMMIVMCIRWIK